MKEKKTRKLVCNITGKVLLASKDYYAKKVEKAGSEELLHSTYICQAASQLLKKGRDIQYISDTLPITDNFECKLSDDDAKSIVSSNDPTLKYKLDNQETATIGIIKSDPDVIQFIENISRD